jgi:dolichol kinase
MHPFTAGFPIRLHVRNDLHLVRKSWHMAMGLTIAILYLAGMSTSMAIMILGSILGWDLIMETARLRSPAFNEKIIKVWGPFMRACEVDRMSGIVYYLAATILAIGIFPRPVAILSVLYLALGDPIASIFGILFGKGSIQLARGKSLVGTSAGILTCAIVTFIFLKMMGLPDSQIAVLSAVGGFAGGLAELMPFDIDDNFTIPVISGFALWLAFIVMGI